MPEDNKDETCLEWCWLQCTREQLETQLSDLERGYFLVNLSIVDGCQVSDVFRYEVLHVKSGENQEWIGQYDFTSAGMTRFYVIIFTAHDVSLDVSETAGTGNGLQQRIKLLDTRRVYMMFINSLQWHTRLGAHCR